MAAPQSDYYIGSYEEDGVDGALRGWLVGSFLPDKPRQTDDVEIKYWEFPAGKTDHPHKKNTVIETTFILKGVVNGEIAGKSITLRAGQYMVVAPGIENNVPMAVEQAAAGLTVKAPSDVSAKKVTKQR